MEGKYIKKKKSKFARYKEAAKVIIKEFELGFVQFDINSKNGQEDNFNLRSKNIIKRITKMLGIFYRLHREDFQFTGYTVAKLCFHFVLHLPNDFECYACFSIFLLQNSHTLQLCQLDEADIFNTLQKNTLNQNIIKSKSTSDSDTEFIISKLKKEKWFELISHRIAKIDLKLSDYITQLRLTFLT
mmetsp:Transcript_7641/g.6767  ORF Transcript_7641/g.6767 Transcript_7641/m.6767 type:complete len:186 (+) Transcript_7641:437-994(+)